MYRIISHHCNQKKNNDSLVRGLESYFITLIKKIKFLTVGVNGKMSQLWFCMILLICMILKSCVETYFIILVKKNNYSLVKGLESCFIILITKINVLRVGVVGEMSKLWFCMILLICMILKSWVESYFITLIKKNNESLVKGLESCFIILITKIKV